MRKCVLKGGEGSSVREAIVAHSRQHSTAEQDPSLCSCLGNQANDIQNRLAGVRLRSSAPGPWPALVVVHQLMAQPMAQLVVHAWRNVLHIMVHVLH